MLQQMADKECSCSNFEESFWEQHFLRMLTASERSSWNDCDQMMNTDVSCILWNLDARHVEEELRIREVTCVFGHGANGDADRLSS